MARIHTLPVMLQGEAGRRLTDELVATLKAGEDPGPAEEAAHTDQW